MKWLLAALLLTGIALVIYVPPWSDQSARREIRFDHAEPMLPMTFTHNDHFGVACATCHHEFVDRTAGLPCIACHVTDTKVAPLLEQQFHTLCRTCHIEKQKVGKPSGPTRSCIDCHLPDTGF